MALAMTNTNNCWHTCRVPLRAVLECVAATAPRYFLESPADVCGGEGTPPPAKCGRRRFQVGDLRA